MQIIETSANRFYQVWDTNKPELAHVWYGRPVKKVRGVWVHKDSAREQLVRKAAARIVQAA